MKKKFFLSFIFLSLFGEAAIANNAIYIATSNNIAKKMQLDVLSNNAANANTVGYEEDTVVFKPVMHKESSRKTNAFVVPQGNYKTSQPGGLKFTNRPLDMAVIGPGYFMILTPRGPRFTLAGAAIIDSSYTLVDSNGYPFASKDGQPLVFPQEYHIIEVKNDGTIYADKEEVGTIGIYDFPPNTNFIKEGASLYLADKAPFPVEDRVTTVTSGALRDSNVSNTKVLTEVIELQRSTDFSQELVKNIASMEKNTISKIMKLN